MKNDKLDVIGYIDEYLIEKADKTAVTKKNKLWLKWGAAACLILILGGAFLIPRTHNAPEMITHYDNGIAECYVMPDNGDIGFESAVKEAREEYSGKDVTYLLGVDIFENGEIFTEEKKEEEYRRLVSEGYELYSTQAWTYQGKGEKQYYTVVVGNFTEEQLSNFKSDPGYGYFFYFVKNGDGSAISVEKDDLITNFPTNHT